jgi:hypothetical protein
MNKLREFIRGVKNLIYWFPVIWKDHQWDYRTIYDILYHKFEAMAPVLRTGYGAGSDVLADQIVFANHLLYLVKEEVHEEYYTGLHSQKWGEIRLEREPYKPSEESDIVFSRVLFKRANAVTDEEKRQERKEFLEAMNRAFEEKEKTRKLLFQFIGDNIEGWWD